jgi:FkbM family methyltransferase
MMSVNRIKNRISRTFSKNFNQFVLKHFGLLAAPLKDQINIKNAIEHFVNVHEVSTIFDIGSFDGCWTRDIGKRFFPNAEFYLFEANQRHFPYEPSLAKRSFNILLSDSRSERDFFSIGGTGDSMYQENSKWYESVKPEKVSTETVDNLILFSELPTPDFVKIDVQGAELDVINGMKGHLPRVRYLLIETNLHNYNSGAPSACAIITRLGEFSFVPRTFTELHTIDGILSQVDILFENINLGRDEYL